MRGRARRGRPWPTATGKGTTRETREARSERADVDACGRANKTLSSDISVASSVHVQKSISFCESSYLSHGKTRSLEEGENAGRKAKWRNGLPDVTHILVVTTLPFHVSDSVIPCSRKLCEDLIETFSGGKSFENRATEGGEGRGSYALLPRAQQESPSGSKKLFSDTMANSHARTHAHALIQTLKMFRGEAVESLHPSLLPSSLR